MDEIIVASGPHSENEQSPVNSEHIRQPMIAFSIAPIRGDKEVAGAAKFNNLLDLVKTPTNSWESLMQPKVSVSNA
ncbi:hypothetical protein IB262_23155 [Ensifer sp. ENS02]|uniref:hypothetical protein n=1 Tax=Ensifer sp. ENS02 TaxID=2769290 RepID=UPI0017874D3F|nr:hypothetical protein [Ensifer sp. ENS02]MBD9522798.1 hypothetical protein [Ensifer sp. ENS02]